MIKNEQYNNQHFLFDDAYFADCHPDLFNAHYWEEKNAVIGKAQGRGTTYFIRHNENELVLRHYYRGGLIGKVISDAYFFTALDKTRAFQEFNLLAEMKAAKLPVPTPVACRIVKQGLVYRADLVTSRIQNANDLVGILTHAPLIDEIWQSIGKVIRRFHDAGIYHHDLNAHNILLDDKENISIIDFDRGERRDHDNSWKQSNLQRLLRSFNKEREKIKGFNWQQSNWANLLEGYNSV